MLDHTLDQVAAAVRRRDELVSTLKPRIYDFLGELFTGMIARGISQLTIQIADEEGVRRFHFSMQRHERFEGIHLIRVARKSGAAPPLLQAEVFAEAPAGLRGVTRPLPDDDVAELYTFISDLQNHEAHARMEVTADALAILMKPRVH